jgi:hypothetical protein
MSRRTVLRGAAVTGVGLGTAGTSGDDTEPSTVAGRSMIGVPFRAMDRPRFGIIGLGSRGGSMLPLLLAVPGAMVTALCDVRADLVGRAAAVVTDAGQARPALFTGGDEDYRNLCLRDDVDFVYIATPWEWHTPMALAAMRGGKHVGVECPIGLTLANLWNLVDTSEQTGRHCIQLENCCYGRTRCACCGWRTTACSASCCTAPAPTCTTCASNCSPRPSTRTSGAAASTPGTTAIFTQPTVSGRSPRT